MDITQQQEQQHSGSQPRRCVIPPSTQTVCVRAIDTTTRMVCNARAFVQPTISGHDNLSMTTMCFLLEHHTGAGDLERVLFDFGARKDYWNSSIQACQMIGGHVAGLEVESGVNEILVAGGIDLASLRSLIWSHWHWDHIGDASKLPPSVDIVVGPGFREAFVRGNEIDESQSFIMSQDMEGHRIYEPLFDITVAGFRANDYFGDGSFYLLDVPGHAIGHICGLARTTPDSFVFLGGDCCHHAGALRPSAGVPMPSDVTFKPSSSEVRTNISVPSSVFLQCHPLATGSCEDRERRMTTPFYEISRQPGSAYADGHLAQQSVDQVQILDADPGVLVCMAHDNKLMELIPLFNDDPESSINGWQKAGFKSRARWDFLGDLPCNDMLPKREPLVEGLRKDGKLISWNVERGFSKV